MRARAVSVFQHADANALAEQDRLHFVLRADKMGRRGYRGPKHGAENVKERDADDGTLPMINMPSYGLQSHQDCEKDSDMSMAVPVYSGQR